MAENQRLNPFIPEIDTLRAVAVLLVVIFHAFPEAMRGGFIGVDVFFVISGFVISRAYLAPLITGEAKLNDFYLARFRRLVPAMALVFVLTAAAAMFLLQPDRLIPFAWSLLAQVLYLQNFVFWIEGDYFSGALTKPLLHTWSLAVEEQFYIFWALLILFFRRFPRSVLTVVVVMGIASLAAGYVVAPRSPKTVFYLLPTRMWEFALGILAYLATRRFPQIGSMPAGVGTGLSIVLIILCALVYGEESAFPGPQALIACLATAVALFCIDRANHGVAALRVPGLLYVGRISYGLYLWHWPPLVLFYLHLGRAANPLEAAGLMAIAFAGAALSYRFLENPIRQRRLVPTARRLLTFVTASSATHAIVAGVIITTSGLLFLYPREIRPLFAAAQERGQFRCDRIFTLLNPTAEFCPLAKGLTGPGVLVLGDSHADVLKEMLTDVAKSGGRPTYLTSRNCDLGRYGSFDFCSHRVLDKVLRDAKLAGVTDVLAISHWDRGQFDVQSLTADMRRLVGAGFRVHLMEVVPNHPRYDPILRARKALAGEPLELAGISLADYYKASETERTIFDQSLREFPGRAALLSPAGYLCETGTCAWQRDGIPYYLDPHHMTFTGAAALRPMFMHALGLGDGDKVVPPATTKLPAP